MYDPQKIEEKWQRRWREERADEPDLDAPERPFYNLMMYPYPSAEGLHVGNLYAFTGADLYGRYRRLRGDEVFQPIGFDAFGIHSENYALKVDIHPMELIPSNIRNFTRQLHRAGIMYDWSHTVDTTDPDYYRWTQWIFLQAVRGGAGREEGGAGQLVPLLQDRARQRAGDRRGVRALRHPGRARGSSASGSSGSPSTPAGSWTNLDWIDWSETTMTAQRNWIGRSEGALLRFPVTSPPPTRAEVASGAGAAGPGAAREHGGRPSADDAASRCSRHGRTPCSGRRFMVLAPEHPLVDD